MTMKFCDKCGEETTHGQYKVLHPSPYAHAGRPMELDVCKGCQERIIALFNEFFGRTFTSDFKKS